MHRSPTCVRFTVDDRPFGLGDHKRSGNKMIRLYVLICFTAASSVCSAQEQRKDDAAAVALPLIKVDASAHVDRLREVWSNIELRGKLMTGSEVSGFMPGAPLPLSASGDVYFVGYTTFLADMPGRVLSASINIHAKDFGNSTITVVRAGNFSKGAREFCVQLWRHNDSMMVMERPSEYSDSDVATHATKLKLSARAEKTFVK